MESQYHEFGSIDNSSVPGEHKTTLQTGMKKIVVCVLYGVLVLLLLILLMVIGIKFAQLNKEITDVKLSLERISNGGTTSLSSSGACRDGWVSFQTSCYVLSTTTVTWSKAEEQCQKHRGHLVVVNDVVELDYISGVVDIKYSYWIGLVEREHEGHWSWVDGTDFNSTPTFWDNGQPDNWDYRETGEDCGQIHASERRKRKMWNDADCNLPYRYICETRA
ncbi:C-type lectin lectoxin-Phi1-like [Anarhichas minor]|uniref:C-type lectin lectoxin-Phi1-like n=1 Tax=Anarhichas minor TaxID=65739 RepID=UPI003F73E682